MKTGLILLGTAHFKETAILQKQEMHNVMVLTLDGHNTHDKLQCLLHINLISYPTVYFSVLLQFITFLSMLFQFCIRFSLLQMSPFSTTSLLQFQQENVKGL